MVNKYDHLWGPEEPAELPRPSRPGIRPSPTRRQQTRFGIRPNTDSPVKTPGQQRLEKFRQTVEPTTSDQGAVGAGQIPDIFYEDQPGFEPEGGGGFLDRTTDAFIDVGQNILQSVMPWASLLPDPAQEQKDQFQQNWSSLTPEERYNRFVDSMLDPAQEMGAELPQIPQFIPDDFMSRHTRQALNAIEVGTRPLDVFAEATWQTLASDIQKGELDPALFKVLTDLVTDPESFVDPENEYLKAFEARPMLQQIAIGFIDPFVITGLAARGGKLALALTKTDAFAAKLAQRGLSGVPDIPAPARMLFDTDPGQMPNLADRLFLEHSPGWNPLAPSDPTIFDKAVPWLYEPPQSIPWLPWADEELPNYAPVESWQFPGGAVRPDAPPIGLETGRVGVPERIMTMTADEQLKRYRQAASRVTKLEQRLARLEKKTGKSHADRREINRIKNTDMPAAIRDRDEYTTTVLPSDEVPSIRDLNYRRVDPLPDNQQQIVIVSREYPDGRRVTLPVNRNANRLLEELDLSPGDYLVLPGSASRAEVRDASSRLLKEWAEKGRNLGRPRIDLPTGTTFRGIATRAGIELPDNWAAMTPTEQTDFLSRGGYLDRVRALSGKEAFSNFEKSLEPDIPPGLIIDDEPAFVGREMPVTQSRAILNKYLDQFPREVRTPGPTTRFIAGAVDLERVAPPPHLPAQFGGYDRFQVKARTPDGPETVAVLEVAAPKDGNATEVIHFYPTVEGGGPGMFRGDAMKSLLKQLALAYPDLVDMRIAGRSAFKYGSELIGPMDARINQAGLIPDAQADHISDVAPRPVDSDPAVRPAGDTQAPVVPGRTMGEKPRTLADLAREAKGMRALTPEQRAAVAESENPVDLTNTPYVMDTYHKHDRLFGPGSSHADRWYAGIPAISKVLGAWSRVALERNNKIAMIGHSAVLHKDIEKAKATAVAMKWWHEAQDALGFEETGRSVISKVLGRKKGIWRAVKVQGYDPSITDRYHATIDDILEDADELKKLEDEFEETGDWNVLQQITDHEPRFVLDDRQKEVINAGLNMQERMLRDAQLAGVDVLAINEMYWHRILLTSMKDSDFSDMLKTHFIGGKRGYTYSRDFEKMPEALEAGLIYETNPYLRLLARLDAGIESTTNQNAYNEIMALTQKDVGLSDSEDLIFRSKLGKLMASGPNQSKPLVLKTSEAAKRTRDIAKGDYEAHMRAVNRTKDPIPYNPDIEIALRRAEADHVSALSDLLAAKDRVAIADLNEQRLAGKFGPNQVVEDIRALIELPQVQGRSTSQGGATEATRQIFQLMRSMITNVDLASTFINGQFLLTRHPIIWGQATLGSWAAFVKEPTAYIAKNLDVMTEGQDAGAIIRPTEYMFERTGLASLPTKIPLLGPVFTRFNRAFEWYVVTAQTELYKSVRQNIVALEDAPWGQALNQVEARDALIDLGKAIRKELGTESYAILGIRPTQQMFESLTFFAARFFRANLGLLGQAFSKQGIERAPMFGGRAAHPNRGAAEARRALVSMVAAGYGITAGIHLAQTGRPPNVTDPYAPDWMQFPMGKGYANVFGPFYGYLRTLARVGYATSEGDFDKAAGEIGRFMNGRSGLALRAIGLSAEGLFSPYGARTFEGEQIDVSARGAAAFAEEFFLPIAPTEMVKGLEEGRWEAMSEAFGLTTRANPYQQLDLLYQKQIQDPLNEMNLARQEMGMDEEKKLGVSQPSFRDATQFEEHWMSLNYPDLYDEARLHAPGDFGAASAKAWENIKSAIKAEEVLDSRLYSPKAAAEGNAIDGQKYIEEFDRIQADKYASNRQVWADADLFDEERLPEDEPNLNKRAMLQYIQVHQRASAIEGERVLMDWDQIHADLEELEREWTPEQAKYVSINTGLWHSPKGAELVNDRRALKEYWELRDQWAKNLSSRTDISAAWADMWEDYDNATDQIKRKMRQTPAYRTLLGYMSDRSQQWIQDNGTKGATIETLLVKWGYEVNPVTPKAIRLLEDIEDIMTDVQLPSQRPVLQMPPLVPGSVGPTQTTATSSSLDSLFAAR